MFSSKNKQLHNCKSQSSRKAKPNKITKFLKDRKAQVGYQLTVFWFLFLLFIIVVGLAGGTYLFFGSGYDFRQVDANALNFQIKKCLIEKQPLFDPQERELASSFYQTCEIDKQIIEQNFFIHLTIDENIYEAGPGDPTQCALQDKNENFPRCTNSTLTKDGKTILIQTGSNQNSKEQLA